MRTPLGRKVRNSIAMGVAWLAVAIALFPLGDMAVLVVRRALPALHWKLFVTVTSGTSGGLANAIVGSAMLVGMAAVIAIPIGVLGGTFVAERRTGAFVRVVRLGADVLAGVPSIAVGYFGYVAMVEALGWGFSALAGGICLSLLMLPYVVRTTDFAVSGVSEELRATSLALGVDHATTVRRVVLRAALPGILTGIMLGGGIAVGETAPLIYTAEWSNFLPSGQLTHSPVGYLTYVVWTFINQPFTTAHELAYAAAFLLMVAVLILNIVARQAMARRV